MLSILGWAIIGAGIGYHAAPRWGFSWTSGLVSGAPWGMLAVLLYFSTGRISLTESRVCLARAVDLVVRPSLAARLMG